MYSVCSGFVTWLVTVRPSPLPNHRSGWQELSVLRLRQTLPRSESLSQSCGDLRAMRNRFLDKYRQKKSDRTKLLRHQSFLEIKTQMCLMRPYIYVCDGTTSCAIEVPASSTSTISVCYTVRMSACTMKRALSISPTASKRLVGTETLLCMRWEICKRQLVTPRSVVPSQCIQMGIAHLSVPVRSYSKKISQRQNRHRCRHG
jgi:hypothetical protein